MTRPDGIYERLPVEDYQAIPAWNASALKRLWHSPAAARYGLREVESLAQKGGTAAHMAVLEPERFERECVVMPHFMGNMNDDTALAAGYAGGKQAKARWLQEHAGAAVIDGVVRAEALGIRDAVLACEPARELLCGAAGMSEVTLIWTDPLGVRCKARLDRLMPGADGGWTIADLKKTPSTQHAAFAAEVARWRMHIQACFYLRGARILKGAGPSDAIFGDGWAFVWVAFEGRPPHLPGVFELSGALRDVGEREVERMLRVVAHCERTGTWPDYADRVRQIELRPYYDEFIFPKEYQDHG